MEDVTVQERLAVLVGVSVDDFVPVLEELTEREAVLLTVGEMDDFVVTEAEADFVPVRELVMVGEELTEDVPDKVCLDDTELVRVLLIVSVDVLDELSVLEGDVVDVADLEEELVVVSLEEAVILMEAVEDKEGLEEAVSVRVPTLEAVSEMLPFAVAEAERVPTEVAERLAGAERVEVGLLVIVAI